MRLELKVAAYQAPLSACDSIAAALVLISERVRWCETAGVDILCCPEAVLGGLADYAPRPHSMAIAVEDGQLNTVLEPLASETVTSIVGFTERGRRGRLYNSAAVFHQGSVAGVYRKLHPAINQSIYSPGDATPVFTVGGLTFGIIICRDSTFAEPARLMASKGATVFFVPSNNGLPPIKTSPEIIRHARTDDVARATENCATVVRADVAGRSADFVAYGCSGIVDREGTLVAAAQPLETGVVVASVATGRRRFEALARAALLLTMFLLCPVAAGAQQLISIPAADGGTVQADLYGAGERGVVLAHGGRFDKSSWAPQARTLAASGYRVVAIDFRAAVRARAGQESECLYDEKCLALDVLSAVRHLRGRLGARTVSVVGASLGGGAAAQAAVEARAGEIDRIVLLAHMPIATPEKIGGRKLFIVARDDLGSGDRPRLPEIREQYDKSPGPKELVVLEGSAHAQFIFDTPEGGRLMREIQRFLSAP